MQIDIQNLNKKYNARQVLFDINLSINLDSKIIGLVGPNGAGKSTLMRVLSGVLLPNSGKIKLNDADKKLEYIQWALKNTLYVPAGERGLINRLSLVNNFRYFCGLKNVNYKKGLSYFESMAQTLEMENLINRDYDQMSTGQKKSAALLNALALKTKLILLDEPSNGLDIDAQDGLKHVLKLTKNKGNQKVLVSSHDVNLLTSVCDGYVFIREGHIIAKLDSPASHEDLINLYHQSFKKEG